ncbi:MULTISPECIES: flavodoxin family protein [Citrifermentans]|uniref:Flavodoxin, putative n=1 Tax=Citrifermentans bemidjiense (strain ATCC BAA-1014 / DSM 16622 / JCM 12645 / Bem) TaxID=404380 RepID=B5ECY2_CITBB|nr:MULTISPECIES: flavodoxin family protein [Citrifermentans]ACH40599.1 flavodoxin, putative [Citrifermentans bemidjiense Bem]
MKKALVTYYSQSGNTRKMAQLIADHLQSRGVQADLIAVQDVDIDTLPSYDGFLVGSPNYFGTMAWPVKKFIDDSIKYYKKLNGKAAAAFTSEGMIGGGGDLVVLDILKAFLIHGCVVQGMTDAGHFGPVSIGAPDERIEKEVAVMGDAFCSLLNRP